MFGNSAVRATALDLADIERRMRAIEKRLDRVRRAAGDTMSDVAERTSAGVSQARVRLGDLIGAVGELGERFLGSRSAVTGEASRLGNEVARVGNDTVRRLADEVEHRPLIMLAVAVGVGVLIGMQQRRR
jgi:ElaB/YqjD/DUF883 family membrane-anchored ribosome-binding protein